VTPKRAPEDSKRPDRPPLTFDERLVWTFVVLLIATMAYGMATRQFDVSLAVSTLTGVVVTIIGGKVYSASKTKNGDDQ